jgi:hypothetical protein
MNTPPPVNLNALSGIQQTLKNLQVPLHTNKTNL